MCLKIKIIKQIDANTYLAGDSSDLVNVTSEDQELAKLIAVDKCFSIMLPIVKGDVVMLKRKAIPMGSFDIKYDD